MTNESNKEDAVKTIWWVLFSVSVYVWSDENNPDGKLKIVERFQSREDCEIAIAKLNEQAGTSKKYYCLPAEGKP